MRWLLAVLFAIIFIIGPAYAYVQVYPSVVFNTSGSEAWNFNETANFSQIRITRGAIELFGPNGTSNFNISTASLNLSARHLSTSRRLNLTINRLEWNGSGVVNVTVRGLGASQSTVVRLPNGTNTTQIADATGLLLLYWTGTENTTNFTFVEQGQLTNISVAVTKGWNLIGLWNDTTLLTASNWTAAPTNITVVQCFNSTSQSWAKYNWTNSTGNSTYLCPKGTAVFIQIGRNDTLNFTISINEPGPGLTGNWTANVSLTDGYNYVLVPGNVSLKNASTWPLKGVQYVSCWNHTKQAYYTYMNISTWTGGLFNTSVCQEGQGIVLQALGNETITLVRVFGEPSGGGDVAYIIAAVLVLSGGAWLYRWHSRKGEN